MKRFVFIFFVSLLSTAGEAASFVGDATKIYDEDGDRIFENLRQRMDRVSDSEEIPVIILYRQDTPVAGTYAVRLRGVSERKIKYTYGSIPGVAARLTVPQIEEIRKDPYVEHIELDAKIYAAMDTARNSFGVQSVRTQFGFTGDGDGISGNYSKEDVVIAIVDTGVDVRHPDLRDKVLYFEDSIHHRDSPYDDNGHGTHVAGVAAGSGKLNRLYVGVAPQAALVVFKILNQDGEGELSDGIEAVNQTIAKRFEWNIRILNLSLEIPGSSNGSDGFSVACNQAVSNGIVVVVAAGNYGPGKRTIGAPAAAAAVISVGAGADLGERGFFLADFSSRGPTADGRIKPDLWGPGVDLRCPRPRTGYSNLSGTSLASPFVAGLVALMLEANRDLTPAQVKNILIATSAKWAPEKKSNEAGGGRLQAYQAVARAANITSNLNPPEVSSVKFVKKSILRNDTHSFLVELASTRFPVAITVVIYNFPAARINLDLISPIGKTVASSSSFDRQTGVLFKPSVAGTYVLKLTANSNTSYLLDISSDLEP